MKIKWKEVESPALTSAAASISHGLSQIVYDKIIFTASAIKHIDRCRICNLDEHVLCDELEDMIDQARTRFARYGDFLNVLKQMSESPLWNMMLIREGAHL